MTRYRSHESGWSKCVIFSRARGSANPTGKRLTRRLPCNHVNTIILWLLLLLCIILHSRLLNCSSENGNRGMRYTRVGTANVKYCSRNPMEWLKNVHGPFAWRQKRVQTFFKSRFWFFKKKCIRLKSRIVIL